MMCQTLCQVLGDTELNKVGFCSDEREKEKEMWALQNEVSTVTESWTKHCERIEETGVD